MADLSRQRKNILGLSDQDPAVQSASSTMQESLTSAESWVIQMKIVWKIVSVWPTFESQFGIPILWVSDNSSVGATKIKYHYREWDDWNTLLDKKIERLWNDTRFVKHSLHSW